MIFLRLITLFPAIALSSKLPFERGHATNADNCTYTGTWPVITVTSVLPTLTIGGPDGVQAHSAGGASLIYTTALPAIGADGIGVHTYTITTPCKETHFPGKPAAATRGSVGGEAGNAGHHGNVATLAATSAEFVTSAKDKTPMVADSKPTASLSSPDKSSDLDTFARS
ncbi:uncharacterized protein FIESC28_09210 [Fusarium coffeatum]|uniref:Uncharacterized protein n=1 Tax=Fusarium coffeatum TaxID=231269 RepID=A0A366R4G0_9HYPO|nr:uncharacterized protein FIESC28_09210 [Fusarium coffeatum]RBR11065.1 hypothetical protein FIESC28_09210 [Fusarium coffeatum]